MNEGAKRELLALAAAADGGLLKAEAVVEYAAKNPDSELHREFEWDDAKAAAEYRLNQARNLIRVYVTELPSVPQRVRGFVSVPSDRANGGGYRRTEDVLRSAALRAQMAEDVLKRAEALKTHGAYLPELAPFLADLELAVAKFRAARVTTGPGLSL